jgi:hypothetical protein
MKESVRRLLLEDLSRYVVAYGRGDLDVDVRAHWERLPASHPFRTLDIRWPDDVPPAMQAGFVAVWTLDDALGLPPTESARRAVLGLPVRFEP